MALRETVGIGDNEGPVLVDPRMHHKDGEI